MPAPSASSSPYKSSANGCNGGRAFGRSNGKPSCNNTVETAARRNGFREGSFDGFFGWLQTPFEVYAYREDVANSLLSEWQESADSLTMLITQVPHERGRQAGRLPRIRGYAPHGHIRPGILCQQMGVGYQRRLLPDSVSLVDTHFPRAAGVATDASNSP